MLNEIVIYGVGGNHNHHRIYDRKILTHDEATIRAIEKIAQRMLADHNEIAMAVFVLDNTDELKKAYDRAVELDCDAGWEKLYGIIDRYGHVWDMNAYG